jgi:hypothetical protein
VKAYPQPSKKYDETVCCAALSEEGRLLRLYPIRYRHLRDEQKFNRFDLVEVAIYKASHDPRPESYKIKEESLRIIASGRNFQRDSKSQLWLSMVQPFNELQIQQKANKTSLGIIRPDSGSLSFYYKTVKEEPEEADLIKGLQKQADLFDDALTSLEPLEYLFYFKFTTHGQARNMQLHDWEVQATYLNYKRRYGSVKSALEKMIEYYDHQLKQYNPHFVMGNMGQRPYQFMIIAVLRASDQAIQQGSLF